MQVNVRASVNSLCTVDMYVRYCTRRCWYCTKQARTVSETPPAAPPSPADVEPADTFMDSWYQHNLLQYSPPPPPPTDPPTPHTPTPTHPVISAAECESECRGFESHQSRGISSLALTDPSQSWECYGSSGKTQASFIHPNFPDLDIINTGTIQGGSMDLVNTGTIQGGSIDLVNTGTIQGGSKRGPG